jgi:catechol 2,3-dioxygenase-like lactoylglutathione lyase family enzyme
MEVFQISAVTLKVSDMKKSLLFYSKIPGLSLRYRSANTEGFSSFEIENGDFKSYLNLELSVKEKVLFTSNFGRIIFHTNNVDKLYLKLKNDKELSEIIVFENEPMNATWGERFFHVKDPDGYELSFATPI